MMDKLTETLRDVLEEEYVRLSAFLCEVAAYS